jgi:hypothetical protein
VFGPKINHRLFRNGAREIVLKELQELEDSLVGALPNRKEVYELGFRLFQDMERRDSSVEFLHYLMLEQWTAEEQDAASWSEMVRARLERAMQDLWRMRDQREGEIQAQHEAQARKQHAAAAKRRAEEAEAKAKRENDAKLHDQIARELGITKRHARNLRSEGTRDPYRARRLAEITGDDPSKFLKTGRRKRETDLVKMFMTAEHGHVSFTHFISDEDDEIADDELRSFLKENVRKLIWGEDLNSLESLVHRVRDLGYELLLETAEDLWKAYKLWRIRTISSIAIYDVEDGR